MKKTVVMLTVDSLRENNPPSQFYLKRQWKLLRIFPQKSLGTTELSVTLRIFCVGLDRKAGSLGHILKANQNFSLPSSYLKHKMHPFKFVIQNGKNPNLFQFSKQNV